MKESNLFLVLEILNKTIENPLSEGEIHNEIEDDINWKDLLDTLQYLEDNINIFH